MRHRAIENSFILVLSQLTLDTISRRMTELEDGQDLPFGPIW